MNNDIAHDINNYVNLPKQDKMSASLNASKNENISNTQKEAENVDMSNSMEILGAINKAKIAQNTPSVIASCKSFIDDPIKAECYNDICDSFVEKGYSLEHAIELADKFFFGFANSRYVLIRGT